MKTIGKSESGAIFSDDMKYRYRLWRSWDTKLPRALFIMLNPSTADEIHNDPTIERQYRRVVQWSRRGLLDGLEFRDRKFKIFGSIEVVNACAWRSTDPEALYEVEEPVGEDNGLHIHEAAAAAVESGGIVVCGWGTHLAKLSAGMYTLHDLLLESLENDGIPLTALKLNSDGTPQHPLYLGYSLIPRKWFDGELQEEAL